MEKRPNIIFDFDGVIHDYAYGWEGPDKISGKPVTGIKEAMEDIIKEYKILIYSTRCNSGEIVRGGTVGKITMEKWLKKYDITYDEIIYKKVPALVSIDDRAIKFNGDSKNLLNEIKKFKVWYK